jgi:integrase
VRHRRRGPGHRSPSEVRPPPSMSPGGSLERWCVVQPQTHTEQPVWSMEERRDPVRSPSPEEVRRLLEAASAWDLRFAVYLRMIAATGMRRAEACALRWSDLDPKKGTVKVPVISKRNCEPFHHRVKCTKAKSPALRHPSSQLAQLRPTTSVRLRGSQGPRPPPCQSPREGRGSLLAGLWRSRSSRECREERSSHTKRLLCRRH